MIKQIIAGILALFTAIFSWFFAESKEIDWKKETVAVLEAIQAGDIDTIEGYMCQDIKDNVPELREKIEKFIDAIEGEITGYTYPLSSSSSWIGNRRDVRGWSEITTTENTYRLGIAWVIESPSMPKEVGVESIWLSVKTDSGLKSCNVTIETP